MCLGAAVLLPTREARAQTAESAVTQFQHLEDNWSIALVNKDQFGLENLLSPTFINISAEAQVSTRNQYIADTLAGLPKPFVSVQQKVVSVRTVSDVAIVEGTYTLRLNDSQHVRDERGIFTHVYTRARDTWTCVNAQRTVVVDALEGARGRASAEDGARSSKDAKSSAALPFHVPLFHKGAVSKDPQPENQTTAPPQ